MNSKQKGARAERALAKRLRDHGFDARRTQQYAGFTGNALGINDTNADFEEVQ